MSGDELLTIRAAAELLDVHENTIRNWANAGLIEVVTFPISGYRRVPRFEVERLREERKTRALIARVSPIQAFLIEQLRAGMADEGWSQAALAREVNISPKHMNQLLSGAAGGSHELWSRLLVQVDRAFWEKRDLPRR